MKKLTRLLILLNVTAALLSGCKKDCPLPTPSPDEEIAKHINDSIWAYYPVTGNLNDASGNNHTLTLNAGATLTYDTWGNSLGAIDFDGIDDYGSIADGKLFPKSNFTLSLIVMPRQNKGFFLGKQQYSNANGASFNVGIDNFYFGDKVRLSITTNQPTVCSQGPAGGDVTLNPQAFNLLAWYHVVATFSNGTCKLYINGNLISTQTATNTSFNNCSNSEFILGDWWSGGHNAFNGKMDEIRIYTRAISDKEVKYLFDHKQNNN